MLACGPVLPAKTHPKSVLKAVDVLWDLDRQAWRITSTKIPTPRRMSVLPDWLYSSTARKRPFKCSQF